MNLKKKECPSCAMEIPSDAEICPICGYEFPAGNNYLSVIVIVLLILMLLYFIF
jgi:RNA polymerase subunit RPABC4/transcription elongation factor Spt4